MEVGFPCPKVIHNYLNLKIFIYVYKIKTKLVKFRIIFELYMNFKYTEIIWPTTYNNLHLSKLLYIIEVQIQ